MTLPHWIWPGFWGLKGKVLEKAKIEYYYSGREKEEKEIEIEYKKDSIEYKRENLKLIKKYKELTDLEYEKELATLNNEPWVHGELKGDPIEGFYFDMYWNTKFIEYLQTQGYTGFTEEESIDMWLTRMYTNELLTSEWEAINQDSSPLTINVNKREDGKAEYK